jgi:2-polyprenyl-3-methyl-5-hydroxy-6-metoxy-1,4-benzoquinol methylase
MAYTSQRTHIAKLEEALDKYFPYFKGTIERQKRIFGDPWLDHFEGELSTIFQSDWPRLLEAVKGYGQFSLDAMKLQKLFDKTHCYENKSYEEAATEVYQNRDYMFRRYLPGIFLSHFLWYHHYKQHLFFKSHFVPLLRAHPGRLFYDIGIGTGFYSKEMILAKNGMRGEGFDLSPFSIEYTTATLAAFGLSDRYFAHRHNIVTEPVERPADFIVCIEVLEHLEDPQEFLNALYRMLAPRGYGLISAALTAPNADHIYLYNEPDEVAEQLGTAGFDILHFEHDPAYEPRKATDSVPRNVVFIVTRR